MASCLTSDVGSSKGLKIFLLLMVKTKASLILATSQNKIYTVERKTLTWQLALYVKRREKLEKKIAN